MKREMKIKLRGIVEKKAISHVEVMMSFVIFILFVLFFFIFFNPFKKSALNESLWDIIDTEIKKNASFDVTTTAFVVDPSVFGEPPFKENPNKCFNMELDEFIQDGSKELIAKNETGGFFESSDDPKANGHFEVGFPPEEPRPKYYSLYLSAGFLQVGGIQHGCPAAIPKDRYTLGLTKTRKIVFMGMLNKLNETYWQDYEGLKKQFNFPKTNDFGFVVRNETNDILFSALRKGRAAGFEVIAKQEPIEIINATAGMTYGKLDVLVW